MLIQAVHEGFIGNISKIENAQVVNVHIGMKQIELAVSRTTAVGGRRHLGIAQVEHSVVHQCTHLMGRMDLFTEGHRLGGQQAGKFIVDKQHVRFRHQR